ncbi:MAG: hypothetical protein ABSB70_03010 [Candidatus Velthaea sp.]|jgi:hypothetical protein
MLASVIPSTISRASSRRRLRLRGIAFRWIPPLAAAGLFALAACGGGGGGSTPAAGSPSPIGGASPAPGPTAVVASPASVAFTAVGIGIAAQSVSVSQLDNTAFTLTTTNCAGIVSVTPTSGAGPFAFSPLAPGTCSYLVSGTGGAAATIGVSVTTTSVVGK